MNLKIKNTHLNYIIAFCVVALFGVVLSFDRKVAIDGDANDYYSYLISIFINHDFTHQTGNNWFLLQTPSGTINVHTIGVSLLILPFFFCAFLFSKIFGSVVDGFSLPFQMSVYISGIFYCAVGLIYLKKLLAQLNIQKTYIALLLILVCFGTNLFNYTVNEPGMAHVYGFALTSMFLYFVLNLFQKRTANYFYLCAIALGLIILVRPVNIILLSFIPFFFQNKYDMLSTFKVIAKSVHFYLALAVLVLVYSVQGIAWYLQNGRFIQDSYSGNGFYFAHPSIFKMLFGFNNGLFVYVPVCLLFLFGIIPMFIINRFKGFAFSFSMIFIFYVFGSYWAYNYFDGFGIRTLVDFLPVFIISGAFLFQNSPLKLKYSLISISFLFLAMNLFYVYQYRHGIIKGNGMNFEKYKYVFFKCNKAYADSLGGVNDLPLYSKEKPPVIFDSGVSFNLGKQNDGVDNFKDIEYGKGFSYELKKRVNNLFVTAEFERKESTRNSSFNALLCFNCTNVTGEESRSFQIYRLNEIPSQNCCEWKKCTINFAVTGKLAPSDKLNLFVWNKEKMPFYIKNFNIKIFDYSYNI